MALRLASWNLHRCIGGDGLQSVERCAAVLKEIDADLVALQEVESHPGHEFDALAALARATGSRAIAGTRPINEWWLWGRPLRVLHRLFPETPHRRSWPSRAPMLALDRIWVSPRTALCSLTTHLSPLARQASDHLPLVAELQWPPTAD